MKLRLSIIAFAVALALLCGAWSCSKLEQTGRDTAAALNGLVASAQSQYATTCKANPAQTVCKTINRGVDGQNALITAIDDYCGWPASTSPANPTAVCVPVKGAQQALNVAMGNAHQLIAELKGLVHP